MRKCLDTRLLTAYASGELPPAEAEAAEAHLQECRRCATALGRLTADDDLLAEVRDLEQSRRELEAALGRLPDMEQRLSTTLFGQPAS